MTGSWWDNASTEARLAQIDGGIECGLTANQVAMASGLRSDQRSNVSAFASRRGRHFPAENRGRAIIGTNRRDKIGRDRTAYFRGDSINLWGTADHRDEFELDAREGA